jgi:pyruvate/2-oxoglutarate dehydrogenase complex dihydrolipoamide acyltransferase (E2) component
MSGSDVDTIRVPSPLQGTVVAIDVAAGDLVQPGQQLLVLEAMKMHHVVPAPGGGRVVALLVAEGETVMAGQALVAVAHDAPAAAEAPSSTGTADVDLDRVRPDLAEVVERHTTGLDAARRDAVARRRATGQRTARENVADLCDPDSFVEYGPLVIAAQRRRRDLDDLIANTPADGMIGGLGTVNADRFGGHAARVIAVSYDYTVLAGTQGVKNHYKKDRLFEVAERMRLPIVFFTEGGGGRPGDTDSAGGVSGLDCLAFLWFARLSGLVPLVGVNAGYCFAGNAAILGCCDVSSPPSTPTSGWAARP